MDEYIEPTEPLEPEPQEPYKVYALLDDCGCILAVNCGVWMQDTTGWTLIDEGTGPRYFHAQVAYLDSPLLTEDYIPRHRWDGAQVVERTAEEIEADRAAIPAPEPSETEQLKAKVAALEAEKAERAELEAMAAAIERGLSL